MTQHYILSVHLADKGVSKDSGTEAEGDFENDKAALADFRPKASSFRRQFGWKYDTITFTVSTVDPGGTNRLVSLS